MFEIKKFNSGEWDVRLLNLKEIPRKVFWNWFKHPDPMVPLMMHDCIKKVFGDVNVNLVCNYIPYSRQERVFEIGQSIPFDIIFSILKQKFSHIESLCCHNKKLSFSKDLDIKLKNIIPVFPDENARRFFSFFYIIENSIIISKKRQADEVLSEIKSSIEDYSPSKFLICDDICDGGRTFVNAANLIKEKYPDNLGIELLVAHGFMTHGLDDLKKSGISKIFIANPDSYEYLTEKFNDKEYIQLWENK